MGVAEHNAVRSNFNKSSGKWYWEITIDSGTTHFVGVATEDANLDTYAGSNADSWSYHDLDGEKYSNGGGITFGDTYVAGDVIGVALDLENNKVWFSKNGVWQDSGLPADGTDPAFTSITDTQIFPIWSGYDAGEVTANFGDSAFSYDVPTDFAAMASGASTITWDEDYLGSEVFLTSEDLKLYTTVSTPFNATDSSLGSTLASEGKVTGKWYWEVTVGRDSAYGGWVKSAEELPLDVFVGVGTASLDVDNVVGNDVNSFGYQRSGNIHNDGVSLGYGDYWEQGDILGVALDLDNHKIWFSKNGVWQNSGDPAAGTDKAFGSLPVMTFYPAGTVAGSGWSSWYYDGRWTMGALAYSCANLTINVGDSAFSYTPPTDFLAYNSISQTYEVTLFENVTTADAYSRDTEFGGVPADHEGALSENVTTSDYFYAELPGDTEDPASGHVGDSFTMSAAITVESSTKVLSEDVTFSDEFTLDTPYRDLDEETTLSDAISGTVDPWYVGIDEDVTTSDLVEAPIEELQSEDVTSSEAITVIKESTKSISETTTTSEEITVSKERIETVNETLELVDQTVSGWVMSIADTLRNTDTVTIELALIIQELLGLTETLASKWDGVETVSELLQLFEYSLAVEVFYDTVAESLRATDTTTSLHTMINAIAESLGIAETSTADHAMHHVIAEALRFTGLTSAIKTVYPSIAESLNVVDTTSLGWLKSIAEALGLTDTTTIEIPFDFTIIETLNVVAAASVFNTIGLSNSESLGLTDTAQPGWEKTISESLGLTDTTTLAWAAMLTLTENLALTETVLDQFYIDETVSEALGLASALSMQAALQEVVTETLELGITITLDDEVYECWVLNSNQFNASIYSGYGFNSYCVYNDEVYGAKSTGIYKLTGTTDDGDAFKAGIVLPDTRFGSIRQKRFRKAWFGLSGGTTPSIRMETESGSQTYTISSSKANISRNLKGRSWVLKVQDFQSLDFIELAPVILTR